MMLRVAFQGELGAYSEEAITQYWRGTAEPVAARTFQDVVSAVEEKNVMYGMFPIENTIVGPIQPVHEVLFDQSGLLPQFEIFDEVTLPIHHALLAPAGATLEGLTSVSSHPAALGQCGRYLRRHPHWTVCPVYDTAGAARDVAARGLPYEAAIAGAGAAKRYNLQILAEEIQDVPNNVTRFVIVGQASGKRW